MTLTERILERHSKRDCSRHSIRPLVHHEVLVRTCDFRPEHDDHGHFSNSLHDLLSQAEARMGVSWLVPELKRGQAFTRYCPREIEDLAEVPATEHRPEELLSACLCLAILRKGPRPASEVGVNS